MENPGGWGQTGENLCGRYEYFLQSLIVPNVILYIVCLIQKGNQRELVHLSSALSIKTIFLHIKLIKLSVLNKTILG